jgi:hypothetical protein
MVWIWKAFSSQSETEGSVRISYAYFLHIEIETVSHVNGRKNLLLPALISNGWM